MMNNLIILGIVILSFGIIFYFMRYNRDDYVKDKYTIPMSKRLSKKDIKNLKAGHHKMTKMMKWFDMLCRKEGIKYWMLGGSLIGVIRHKGFIPWDGDIDVGMLDSDYNKLSKILKKEIPNTLVFIPNENNYLPVFETPSKIRDLYSFHYEGVEKEGLCIDIFRFKKQGKYIVGKSGVFGAPDKFKRRYDEVFPLKEGKFEDINVYIPNKTIKNSKKLWGNYPPTLPPLKKRYPHEGKIVADRPNKYMMKKYRDKYREKKT